MVYYAQIKNASKRYLKQKFSLIAEGLSGNQQKLFFQSFKQQVWQVLLKNLSSQANDWVCDFPKNESLQRE